MSTSFIPTPLGGGAISLNTQATVAFDPGFQQRVILATAYVANEVLAEPSTDTNYTQRAKLAYEVLRLAQALNFTWTIAILSDLITTTGSTDQQLVTRIEELWDNMAGLI